jgi:hypothetical protein
MPQQIVTTGTVVKKLQKPKKDKDGKTTGEYYLSLIVNVGTHEEMVEVAISDFEKAVEGAPVKIVQEKKIKVWQGVPKFSLETVGVSFKAA